MRRYLFALLLVCPGVTWAQTPDQRGEAVTKSVVYKGVRADAPIPPALHVRNEGGSDGAGLCVVSSVLANGMYQGVPNLKIRGPKGKPTEEYPDGTPGPMGKGSQLWKLAKSRPGGYYPNKLASLVAEAVPGEKYASYTGSGSLKDRQLLEKVSKAGYPIGVTMNTGQLYRYQYIHHMVSLIFYRIGGWACVVDNNRPGFYSWMPASEFDKRWPDGDTAWMWFWTRLPKSIVPSSGIQIGVLLCLIACLVVVAAELYSRSQPELESEL